MPLLILNRVVNPPPKNRVLLYFMPSSKRGISLPRLPWTLMKVPLSP